MFLACSINDLKCPNYRQSADTNIPILTNIHPNLKQYTIINADIIDFSARRPQVLTGGGIADR